MTAVIPAEGPYLINLAPDLAVGDPICFALSPGDSVVSSSRELTEPIDAVAVLVVDEPGVQSPHCVVSRSAVGVTITALRDNALIYVNGELLTTPQYALSHNDRIILGQRCALRFVEARPFPEMRPRASKIVDWELCCEEFARRMKLFRGADEFACVEQRVLELEEELAMREPGACLCLIGGGGTHTRRRIWALPSAAGESVAIGTGQAINVPTLKGMVVLECDGRSYTLRAESMRKKLADGATFTVRDHTFILFAHPCERGREDGAATSAPPVTAVPLPADHFENRDVRNAMFDLQFTVLQAFKHFVVPESPDDCAAFKERRALLEDEQLLEDPSYGPDAIVKHAQYLTDTIRLLHAAPQPPALGGPYHGVDIEAAFDVLREKTAMAQRLNDALDSAHVDPDTASRWQLRLYAQEQQIARQATRIAQLESQLRQLVGDSKPSPKAASVAQSAMTSVKERVLTFTPTVVARMLQVTNAIAINKFSPAWKQYVGALTQLLDEAGNINCIPEHMKGRVLMAIVDVACAYEIGRRGGSFTPEELHTIAKRAPSWEIAAEHCAGSDKLLLAPTPSARSVSPMERGKSPYSRQSSAAAAKSNNSRSVSPTTAKSAAALPPARLLAPPLKTAPLPRHPTPAQRTPSTQSTRQPSPAQPPRSAVPPPPSINSARSKSPLGATGRPAGAAAAAATAPTPGSARRVPSPGTRDGRSTAVAPPGASAPGASARARTGSSDRRPSPLVRTPSPRTLLARSLLAKAEDKPAFR